MSKLSDIKNSLKQLELLGLPISESQRRTLALAEEEFVDDELIPQIKEALKDTFNSLDVSTRIVVEYDGRGNINVHSDDKKSKVIHQPKNKPSTDSVKRPKAKPTFLKLTYQDGRIINGSGTKVLLNFINEVGPEKVHRMNIICCKLPLVDDHLSDGQYRNRQKPLNNGYYLMTNSDTQTKKDQITEIIRNLHLDIKVDVIDENGVIVG